MSKLLDLEPYNVTYRETYGSFVLWLEGEKAYYVTIALHGNYEHKVTGNVGNLWNVRIGIFLKDKRLEPLMSGMLWTSSVNSTPQNILDDIIDGTYEDFVDEKNYHLIERW